MNCPFFRKNFQRHKLIIYWSVFGLGLIFLIFIQYYGVVHFHYAVPPGHDAAIHYNMAQPFYEGKINFWSYLKSGQYPPGFLIIISFLAHLFNTDTLSVMLWLTPMIVPAAAVILFLLARQTFGNKTALISFFLYSFAAVINIQQLNDGGYPNLIAAQILLPLFFLIVFSINSKDKMIAKLSKAILALIFLMAIPLTHHLTTLYLGTIFIILLPLSIIYFWSRYKWPVFKGLSYLMILIVASFALFFIANRLSIFASTFDLVKQNITYNSVFPYIHLVGRIDPEAAVSLKTLPHYIGYPVFIFGVIGLVILLYQIFTKKNNRIFPISVILLWALILLFGSRLTFLTNPDRLARDSVFPLAILAGVGLLEIGKWIGKQRWYFFLPISIIIAFIILLSLKTRIYEAFRYNPMVKITSADLSAVNYLKDQPQGTILIEAYSFYFDRFLPGWQIFYLYQPQTQQKSDIHVLDPSNPSDLEKLRANDYVYVVDWQSGWLPEAVQSDTAKLYLGNANFKLVRKDSSETNSVYLFQVLP